MAMDRASPIFNALVEQTTATIAMQTRQLEMMESGIMRVRTMTTTGEHDDTADWIERLKQWKADNERLLSDIQEGRI